MSKTSLRFLAVLLTFLIIVVLAAGLDDLPRSLRDRIDSEQKALTAARGQVASARAEIGKDLSAEPRLFAAGGLAAALPVRLMRAEAELSAASSDAAALTLLRKANRREDKDRVAALLAKQEKTRASAAREAQQAQADAVRRMEFKTNLPATLRQMEANHRTVAALDLAPVAAAVARASGDWPEKKPDLESRLAALRALPAQAESQWQASAAARAQASAGEWEKLDPALLVGASEALDRAAVSVPAQAVELKALSDQLYTSWDKILVDLEVRRHGNQRDYLEKLRTVRTRLLDPAAKKGETSSDENWVEVSRSDYQAVERNLGMAIQHKSAGQYDSEAERWPSRRDLPTWRRSPRAPTSTATGTAGEVRVSGSGTGNTPCFAICYSTAITGRFPPTTTTATGAPALAAIPTMGGPTITRQPGRVRPSTAPRVPPRNRATPAVPICAVAGSGIRNTPRAAAATATRSFRRLRTSAATTAHRSARPLRAASGGVRDPRGGRAAAGRRVSAGPAAAAAGLLEEAPGRADVRSRAGAAGALEAVAGGVSARGRERFPLEKVLPGGTGVSGFHRARNP